MVDIEIAKKVAFDFNKSIRERVDWLLKQDCDNYTNLGSDSTDEERKAVKETSKGIYQIINGIDEETGKLLVKSMDS